MLQMRAVTRALTVAVARRSVAAVSRSAIRSVRSPLCCAAAAPLRVFSSASAPPSTSTPRPSFQPDAASHTSAASAPGAERPPRNAPSTTADEQADAEAGLNQPVQSGEQKRAEQQAAGGNGGGGKGGKDKEEVQEEKPLGPGSWGSVAFLIIVGGAAVVYFRYQQDKLQNTVRVETIGKPLLGGPFNLIDDSGKRVSSDSMKGKYVLLYFGFTHCPDICPTELKKMEEALDQFEKIHPSHPITPVFISIDPRRDTVARLRDYKKAYDPRMLWLTGSPEEVAAVAKSYRVYYSAPDVASGSDDDYLVDHSIFFYLLDREGQFMEFFGKSKSAEEVAGRMAQLVGAENTASNSK